MLKAIKKISAAILLQATALTLPVLALAQGGDLTQPTDLVPKGEGEIGNIDNIIIIIQTAIRFILVVAFVLAFIFLIIGGIRWIVAGGDEKGVAGARGMITAALIGLVIVLVSFALIRLVETFFGVTIISEGVSIPTINQ